MDDHCICPSIAAIAHQAHHLLSIVQTVTKNCDKLETKISADIIFRLFAKRFSGLCEENFIELGKTRLQSPTDTLSTAHLEKLYNPGTSLITYIRRCVCVCVHVHIFLYYSQYNWDDVNYRHMGTRFIVTVSSIEALHHNDTATCD